MSKPKTKISLFKKGSKKMLNYHFSNYNYVKLQQNIIVNHRFGMQRKIGRKLHSYSFTYHDERETSQRSVEL